MSKLLLMIDGETDCEQLKHYEFINSVRYMKLIIDDKIQVLMQTNDLPCLICEQLKVTDNVDYEKFCKKYSKLFENYDNLATKLSVKFEDVSNGLKKLINCIGCCTATEKFFQKLVKLSKSKCDETISSVSRDFNLKCSAFALDPMYIDSNGCIALKTQFINNHLGLYVLFNVHAVDIQNKFQAKQLKAKANSRCSIHSLENVRYKVEFNFSDFWESSSIELQKQISLITISDLTETIEKYLVKHKFCYDCKSKITLAFDILTGKALPCQDDKYMPSLYEGIECCNQHIHLQCDKNFLYQLVKRGEPELVSRKSERHASTIDTAQEEVLKCIGMHITEKFHKIWMTMKTEEFSWYLLYYSAIYKLKECFEAEYHRIQGQDDLKSLLAEFSLLDTKVNKEKDKMKKSPIEKEQKKKSSKPKPKEPQEKKSSKKSPNNNNEGKCVKKVNETSKISAKNESKSIGKCLEEVKSKIKIEHKNKCKIKKTNTLALTKPLCTNKISANWNDTKVLKITDVNRKKSKVNSVSTLDLISLWNEINCDTAINESKIDETIKITDEEINEYYLNKESYIETRKLYRISLKEKVKIAVFNSKQKNVD